MSQALELTNHDTPSQEDTGEGRKNFSVPRCVTFCHSFFTPVP